MDLLMNQMAPFISMWKLFKSLEKFIPDLKYEPNKWMNQMRSQNLRTKKISLKKNKINKILFFGKKAKKMNLFGKVLGELGDLDGI